MDTLVTVHRFAQVVGRVRLAASPRRNHWWKVPFHLAHVRHRDHTVRRHRRRPPVLDRPGHPRGLLARGRQHRVLVRRPGQPRPAFYSYAAPEPDGLADEPLPAGASWVGAGASHLAVLPYDTARASGDPAATVLEFAEAAYCAGATRAGWDVDRHACAGGVIDPVPG